MTYWLGIDKPEVWEDAKRKYNLDNLHLFGFPEGRRKSVQQMKTGDRIVNYMTRPHKRFFAVWEIASGHRIDNGHILAGTRFSECVEVKPIVKLSPEKGVENNWGISVRQSAIRLPEEVGEKILSALQDVGRSS
jgi:hypothetical protein